MANKTNAQSNVDMQMKNLKDEFAIKLECFELEKAIMLNELEKLKLKLKLVEKEKQLALHKKDSKLQDQMTEIEQLKSELRTSQELVVREKKKTRDHPTHFLAIKITSPDMLESLKAKQAEIRALIRYLPKKHHGKRKRPVDWERTLVPTKKLHITLNMLCLPTKECIESAKRILKEFDRSKLDELFGKFKGVKIRDLDHFNKHVLFAKIQHPAPLEKLFTYLRQIFKAHLMEKDDRSLKAHVTIMKSSRVSNLRNLDPVLTLALKVKKKKKLSGYQLFEKLQLCSMQEKKGKDGYYFVEEEVPLTFDAQETGYNDEVDHSDSASGSERSEEGKDKEDTDESLGSGVGKDLGNETVESQNGSPLINYFSNLGSLEASKDPAGESVPNTINKESNHLHIRENSNVPASEFEVSNNNIRSVKSSDDSNSKVMDVEQAEGSTDESHQQLSESPKRCDSAEKLVEPVSPMKVESNESGKEYEQERRKNKASATKGAKHDSSEMAAKSDKISTQIN